MLEKKIKHKFALGQKVYFLNDSGVPVKGEIDSINFSIFFNEEGKEIKSCFYVIVSSYFQLMRLEEETFATPEELAKEIVKMLKKEEEVDTKKD